MPAQTAGGLYKTVADTGFVEAAASRRLGRSGQFDGNAHFYCKLRDNEKDRTLDGSGRSFDSHAVGNQNHAAGRLALCCRS